MKKHLLLFCITLIGHKILAQTNRIDTNATFVIANGGLHLRSEPNVHSRKQTTIPFGSTVQYLSEKSFHVDSTFVRHTGNPKGEEIVGNWVKVEYKKMKGYVLDTYLGRKPEYSKRFGDQHNTDFVLLYPGCGCDMENVHDPSGWKWYGYFTKGEGQYSIEEVQISYYRTGTITCDLILSASKNDSLSFIIGRKKGFKYDQKVVRGEHLNLYVYDRGDSIQQSDLNRFSVELVTKKGSGTWEPSKLYIKIGNRKQLLNQPEFDHPNEILFKGDLDGDLKDDYIIHYGDKGGIVILYLTSKAKSGELIDKVAIFFSSYCC